MEPTSPILRVENLSVAYRSGRAWLDAVQDVSLAVHPGETYGLVGESGSGKTTLANAVMRYLGENARVRAGKIEFNGRDLYSLPDDEMRRIWGAEVSLVPQNPLSSLNPSIRIGEQVAEILRHHQGVDKAAARKRAVDLLARVRLPDPERLAEQFPHQVSGGMQQRVMIAMALSTSPRLLVLDEPTTSLDVTTQASILDLFRDLIQDSQTAVLFVTHNLGAIAEICDRVAVLYAGELVEDAPLAGLFDRPLHPYTRGLLDSIPRLGQYKSAAPLQSIPGQIPPLGARPSGCIFTPRCTLAVDACSKRPPLAALDGKRFVRCHRWEEILENKISARQPEVGTSQQLTGWPAARATATAEPGETPVLSVKNLSVHFDASHSFAQALVRKPPRKVRAVEKVTLEAGRSTILGLVGESGSGKSSLVRAVAGLVEKTGGEMELLGLPLPQKLSRRDLATLRHIQMVFQNPEEAFNPYLTIGDSLRRPLVTLLGKSQREADAEAKRLLAAVRLPGEYMERMPSQLSGGEKQRVAIARAFATNPDLLIADEPISSLDVSVQASILNLLSQLQAEHRHAMLFISHDLAVVSYLADEIAVIYLGHLMEIARSEALLEPPYHPYTEALLSAIPLGQPGARGEIIHLEGDIPSPTMVWQGCPFSTRCPRVISSLCIDQVPPWQVDAQTGKRYSCHIRVEDLRSIQKKLHIQ